MNITVHGATGSQGAPVAALLTAAGHPGEPLTGDELARSLGEALGRRLRWQTISPEAFADALRPHLGDHAAEGTAAVYRMLAEMPPGPAPDPAPAREALDWAPHDPATWAREVPWPLRLAA